jgi:hypothetical protein
MAKVVTIQNFEELEYLVLNKDLNLSNSIIDSILNNLEIKEEKLHFMDLIVKDEGIVYSLDILKENFIDTLERNLEIQQYHEQFEKCIEIQQAIIKLKK